MKEKKIVGSVFEITVGKEKYWGCVTCNWILSGKKPDSVGFVLLENPQSLDRIGRIMLPGDVRYTLYTAQKWIGSSHWPVIGSLDVIHLPEKLFLGESAGFLHDYRLRDSKIRPLADDELMKYQSLAIGNYSVAEYILENTSVKFVDAISKNIIFSTNT